MKEGDVVIARYKSGVYAGELLQLRHPKAKVRVLAVLKHPEQGDLHHPQRADVPMFHIRRALHYREVANVFVHELEPFGSAKVPPYETSLKEAWQAELDRVNEIGGEYGMKAAAALKELEKDYFGN